MSRLDDLQRRLRDDQRDKRAVCLRGMGRTSLSYASRAEWLGVPFSMEGTFIRTAPGQITRLEVMAPDQKGAFVHALLATWIKTIPSAPYP